MKQFLVVLLITIIEWCLADVSHLPRSEATPQYLPTDPSRQIPESVYQTKYAADGKPIGKTSAYVRQYNSQNNLPEQEREYIRQEHIQRRVEQHKKSPQKASQPGGRSLEDCDNDDRRIGDQYSRTYDSHRQGEGRPIEKVNEQHSRSYVREEQNNGKPGKPAQRTDYQLEERNYERQANGHLNEQTGRDYQRVEEHHETVRNHDHPDRNRNRQSGRDYERTEEYNETIRNGHNGADGRSVDRYEHTEHIKGNGRDREERYERIEYNNDGTVRTTDAPYIRNHDLVESNRGGQSYDPPKKPIETGRSYEQRTAIVHHDRNGNYKLSKPKALPDLPAVSYPLATAFPIDNLRRNLFIPAVNSLDYRNQPDADRVVYTAPNSVFHTQINVQSQGSEFKVPNASALANGDPNLTLTPNSEISQISDYDNDESGRSRRISRRQRDPSKKSNHQGINLINGNVHTDKDVGTRSTSTSNLEGNHQGINIINGNVLPRNRNLNDNLGSASNLNVSVRKANGKQ